MKMCQLIDRQRFERTYKSLLLVNPSNRGWLEINAVRINVKRGKNFHTLIKRKD